MKHKDSAAKMAAFPVNTAAKMAAFPVSRGSYQQPSATRQKKAEAKKRKSPCTPYREKGKGKESDRRVLSRNRLSRADARATARTWCAPCPGLDAWRVGVEEFHFALMDKLAEDAADGTRNIRSRAAAFQAFLNERFPKPEGGAA